MTMATETNEVAVPAKAKKPRVRKPKAKATAAVAAQPVAPKRLFSLEVVKTDKLQEFGEVTEEKRGQILTALNYIEMLGATTGTNLGTMDIFDVFGKGTPNIVTDHAEINKCFFEYLEGVKNAPPVPQEFDDKVRQQIDAVTKALVEGRLATLRAEHDGHVRYARDHQKRAEDYVAAAYNVQVQIDNYKVDDATISKQVEDILRENFWSFVSVDKNKLRLVTTGDVMSPHKDRKTGKTGTVNFGRIMAELHLGKMHLVALPFENNVTNGTNFHPHIYDGGRICWGNAGSQATKYLSAGNINAALKLLAAVLSNYNDDGGSYTWHVEGILNKGTKLTPAATKRLQDAANHGA